MLLSVTFTLDGGIMCNKLKTVELSTPTIDKLFIELSNITKAKTKREQELEFKYNELLMTVSQKFNGESRHQTALRYLKLAEQCSQQVVQQNKEVSTHG